MRFVFNYVFNSVADAEKFGDFLKSDASKDKGIKAWNQIRAVYQVEVRHYAIDEFLDWVESLPVECDLLNAKAGMIQ
ncbi:hypothetical protein ACLIX5_004451 [Salmonella enterica subsp. enterica serovar Bredeney]